MDSRSTPALYRSARLVVIQSEGSPDDAGPARALVADTSRAPDPEARRRRLHERGNRGALAPEHADGQERGLGVDAEDGGEEPRAARRVRAAAGTAELKKKVLSGIQCATVSS